MTVPDCTPFASLTPEDLERELVALGARRFVADQVLRAVYERNVRDFADISNVSLDLRRHLAERYALRTIEVLQRRDASDGSFKLLLRLSDGNVIECALLATGERGTACISSQVGCAMGCVFCASGEAGLVRNLDPHEMVEQVLLVRDALEASPRRLTHVTVMGVGEPLANLDCVLRALDLVNDARGLNIGARRISISTCGLPEAMRRFAEAGRAYHLAVSLHAPDDDLRRRLMPRAASHATVAEVVAAAREVAQRTGRKVTFEYVLIRGVNDDVAHAEALGRLLGGFPSMVNVIPLNATTGGGDLAAPSPTQTGRFLAALERCGVEACRRHRRGAEVDAACGQLRTQFAHGGPRGSRNAPKKGAPDEKRAE